MGSVNITVTCTDTVDLEIKDGILYRVGVVKNIYDIHVACQNKPEQIIPSNIVDNIKETLNTTYRRFIEPNWDTVYGNMLDEMGMPFKKGGFR